MSDIEADLRARVRAFCSEHDPAVTPRAAFLSARFDAGLAAVHYPGGHGGLGLPRTLQPAADEEFARAGSVKPDERRNVIGLGMAAPTIIAFGSDDFARHKPTNLMKCSSCNSRKRFSHR